MDHISKPDVAAKSRSWRDVLPIHPAAALFPRPSDDELSKLGADIRERGVLFPIAFHRDRDGNDSLLDGISRLDAMERAGVYFGITCDRKKIPYLRVYVGDDPAAIGARKETRCVLVHDDPHGYVVAVNIRRRHLTAEQKRDLIAKLIRLDPSKSDRQIAEKTDSNRTTVGQVRKGLEATGDVSIIDTSIDTKGRKQPRARKSSNTNSATDLTDAELSAAKRKTEAALADRQLDFVEKHADFSEPSPAPVDDGIPDFLRRESKANSDFPDKPDAVAALQAQIVELRASVAHERFEHDGTSARLRALLHAKKGCMTNDEYRLIVGCLHPDQFNDEATKQRYTKAMQIFTGCEVALRIDKKEAPPAGPSRATREDWDAMKAGATAKRGAKRKAGKSPTAKPRPQLPNV